MIDRGIRNLTRKDGKVNKVELGSLIKQVYSLSPMGSYLMLWANPTGYASYLVGKGAEQAYMDTIMSTATD